MTVKKTTTRKSAPKASSAPMLTMDGKSYPIESLSAQAQAQVQNIRLTDQRLEQLQVELAITQTARQAYVQALTALLADEQAAT